MTSPIDIRPCDLAIVQDILRQHLPREAKVWVFGSRATWTTKDSSDLDLAIDVGRPLTRQESGNLSEAFDESNLPYKVDIVDMQTVSERFKKIIERDMVGLSTPNEHMVKVFEFCPFVYGKALPAHKRNESGKFPVYGSSGIIGYHTEALTSGATVIIGRKGTVGQVYFSKEPCWPIDTTFYVEGSSNRDIRYTYYALQSLGLENMNGDSAVPGLNREHAHSQELPNKTRDEQKAIAEVLGALDDKIELNRRMNQTLEAMAQALFKDWFVDFAPTRAKMADHPAYLPQDIWDLFPDKLDDEGKPEGWRIGSIRELCEKVESGGTPSRKMANYWENGTLPWLTSGEVRQKIVLSTKEKITALGLDKSSAKLWPRMTTVVAMYGATAGQVTLLGNQMSANQACCGLIPNSNSSAFIFLKTSKSVSVYKIQATGSAQQNLNQTIVASLPTIIPDNEVLKKFENKIVSYISQIIQNICEIGYLEETRKYLLEKLISGEVRLR